jgi:hypothetical protein
MPPPDTLRQDALARAMAEGSTRSQAYVTAGFADNGKRAMTLGGARAIKTRTAQIEAARRPADGAGLAETIGALLDLAVAAATPPRSAGGIKEARLARLEALRLRQLLETQRPGPEATRVVTTLTDEQWREAFGVRRED